MILVLRNLISTIWYKFFAKTKKNHDETHEKHNLDTDLEGISSKEKENLNYESNYLSNDKGTLSQYDEEVESDPYLERGNTISSLYEHFDSSGTLNTKRNRAMSLDHSSDSFGSESKGLKKNPARPLSDSFPTYGRSNSPSNLIIARGDDMASSPASPSSLSRELSETNVHQSSPNERTAFLTPNLKPNGPRIPPTFMRNKADSNRIRLNQEEKK